MKFRKTFLTSLFSFILTSSILLITFSSKVTLNISEKSVYLERESYLNDKALVLRSEDVSDLVLLDKGFVRNDGYLKVQTESYLEKEAEKFIEVYDLKIKDGSFSYEVRIRRYNVEKIEKLIYTFLDDELNIHNTKIHDYKEFSIEMTFINAYLNDSHINANNSFEETLSKLYLKKISLANIAEFNYLNTYAYNQYRAEIENERRPNHFTQTINGWKSVESNFDKFMITAFTSITTMIITTVILSYVASAVAGTIVFKTLLSVIWKKLTLMGFTNMLFLNVKILVALSMGFLFSFPISQVFNSVFIKLYQKNNISNIIEKNRLFISGEYGEDIFDKYKDFFMGGFSNGIVGKLSSLFGKLGVKDRAVLIFDKIRNPMWDLNYVNSYSYAKYRKWLPWITYEINKSRAHYMNNNARKMTFFTATLASKSTWLITYFGDIKTPLDNFYEVHHAGNWLEKTRLEITPNFTKKTNSAIKAMYVSKNLRTASVYARVYYGNEMEFADLDYRVKNILRNYPKSTNKNVDKFIAFSDIYR
ncbi:hypothetical protein SCHIN_v1c02300 [Spiroplasma chinense]|uniref:Uncharacterized protein n=1 Tax=Spiroplasma chinense TaxID=216932 RepID=A0A5B9Y596_9MOLU|nr:hypothetical protein [Spiroplasma chinense]QEH61427.1 hypothetical protein SCHIN_v1c02300 [Spiroplasma chinense]